MSEGQSPADPGQRLHPATLLVNFVGRLPDLALPLVAAIFSTRGTDVGLVPVIAAVLAVSLGFRWLAWQRFRYWITADEVRIEQGLLARSARSIPFARIADVSIEQGPLARLFGLGAVRFETGGGEGEDAALNYVALDEAARLRAVIRARRSPADRDAASAAAPAGTEINPGLESDADAGQVLFAMDWRRLLTLGCYSFSLILFAVLAGAAQQFDFLLPFDLWDADGWARLAADNGLGADEVMRSFRLGAVALAALALVVIGFASGIVRAVLTQYGFRLDLTAKGLRRQRGLLTRSDVTLPLRGIHAARIGSGPWRERRGWYRLDLISLADGGKDERDHVVAPLARLAELGPILATVGLHAPGAAALRPPPLGPWVDRTLMAAALLLAAVAAAVRFVGAGGWWLALAIVPVAAMLLLEWRRQGHAVAADQLVARRGWWHRWVTLARQVNVQSVTLTQGPLYRRRGLARIHFGIAGGTLEFAAVPLAEAVAIRDQVLAVAAPVDYAQL